ncbi:MAG: hypothetical protein AAFO09_09110, partial [Pseudomonadota bacterium]
TSTVRSRLTPARDYRPSLRSPWPTATDVMARLTGSTSSRLISLALGQVRHTGPAEAGLALGGSVGGAAGPGYRSWRCSDCSSRL